MQKWSFMKSVSTWSWYALLLLAGACQGQRQAADRTRFSPRQELVLLDSLAATQAVIRDAEEGFFDRVGILDMSIQMRRNYPDTTPWERVRTDYQRFLQADVTSFSPTEKEQLRTTFRRAHALCEALHPSIFPGELKLIKSKGQPYGPLTFYTRENCIVIPQGILGAGNEEGLLDVALHEIFHIYSRYHPKTRNALYALIGFEALPADQMLYPQVLRKRILLNPDGINCAYRIQLRGADTNPIQAIPLIVANEDQFLPEKDNFFGYLAFNLYEVETPRNAPIKVRTDEAGFSTLNLREHPDFFEQITDNTQYIIHPDEIMADNFMLLATGQTEAGRSPTGQDLLKAVERILRQSQ